MRQGKLSSTITSVPDNDDFAKYIVRLISIDKQPELAIELLSKHYHVTTPFLRVGLPKGEKRALGCYMQRDKTIYISKEDYLYDAYVLIHEFYHHLRHVGGKHRGTERHARDFALNYLRSSSQDNVVKD